MGGQSPRLRVYEASTSSHGGGVCRRGGVGRREGGEFRGRKGGGRTGVGLVAEAASRRSRGMMTAGTGWPRLRSE